VIVRGGATCPAASAVLAKVGPLVPASNEAPDVADIVRDGAAVTVTLTRPDGRTIGTQTLRGNACDDLAEAVAVILASWENDEARRAGVSLAPLPAPTRPREPPARPAWNIAAAIGGALEGDSLSPAAMASASASPAASAWGLRAGGGIETSGTADLPHGVVRWMRFIAGGGPNLAWSGASIGGEAHVGAYASWIRTRGEGFADNRQGGGFELSLVGSARVSLAGRGIRPFVEAALAYRPSPLVAYELPLGSETKLPALGVFVVAGALLRL
jgi:hypothetical protein